MKQILLLIPFILGFSYLTSAQNHMIPCDGSEIQVAYTTSNSGGHTYTNGFPVSVVALSGNTIWVKVTVNGLQGSPWTVNTGLTTFANMDQVLYNIGLGTGAGWADIFYKAGSDINNPSNDWSSWSKSVAVYSAPDTVIPTASNPATIRVECADNVPVPDILVVTDAADNCGIPTVTFVGQVTDSLTCPETLTRTYNVDDGNGNDIDVIQYIVINDITNPVPNGSVLANSVDVVIASGGATNGWSPWVYSFNDPIPAGAFVTGIDLTYTAVDQGWGGTGAASNIYVAGRYIGSGNLSHSSQTFTLNYSGTMTDYVYGGSNDLEMYFVGYGGWTANWQGGTLTIHYAFLPVVNAEGCTTISAPSALDNCAGTVSATTVDPTSYNSPGNYTIDWSFDDGCNVIHVAQSVVISNDVTAAVADMASLSDVTDECSVAALMAPTATDNCAGVLTVTNNATLPITDQGTTIVTWTYDDGNGNTSLQMQNVIISDVITPVEDIASLSDITSQCAVATLTVPTATDNCAGSLTATHNVTLPITALGTTVVTWTYDDGNGNTSSQTQNVIISTDITAPVADAASLSDVTDECSVATLTIPTATDNCAGSLAAIHNVTLPITDQGTTIVTWTFDDGNGNTSSQTQNVIITDATAPILNLPALTDVGGECSFGALTAPTATDNCAGTITGTHNLTLPITTQGTTMVTWTYDDGNGNTSTQTQRIVIMDVTAPTADAASLSDVTGCFEATPTTVPTATDNCVGSLIGTSNVSFPITTSGTTIVTWTFDDGYGNTSTQTQNVIVNTVDTSVTQAGSLLSADEVGATYQWLDCGNVNGIISSETNQSFMPAVTGNYAVEVTINGCVDTSSCFIIDYAGIDGLTTSANLVVYPNPSNDGLFTIQFEGSISAVVLYDMVGRMIDVPCNVNQGTLDASALNAGKYLIRVNANDSVFMKQLVIVK
jgi:hypothetical protein